MLKMWVFLIVLCTVDLHCANSEVPASSQLSPAIPCFLSCVCKTSSHIHCTANVRFTLHVAEFNKFLLHVSSKESPQVHIQIDTIYLPSFLPRLPVLHYLSMAENKLVLIQKGVLIGMRLHYLNLSHNEIETIHEEAFHDLQYLQKLDISHNRLSSISKRVFSHLPSLKVLNLDCNRMMYFPFDAFSQVPHLEVLSLNHNQLSYLIPGSLLSLSALRSLELRNNSLWSLVAQVTDEIPALELLDISANPFHCSCSAGGLTGIMNSGAVRLIELNYTTCFTPLSLHGQRVPDVVMGLQKCQKPFSLLNYDSLSVLYRDDIQLSCDIQGNPDPAVLWLTPWGDQFADPAHWPRLESVCTACQHQRRYTSSAVSMESTVFVTRRGKSLHITNFRGFFNGNITCQAYNYLGNDTAVWQVEVFSTIPGTVVDSIFMGVFCAGGFLSLGLLVGSIKLLAQVCMTRFGNKRKVVRTPSTAVLSSQECNSVTGRHSFCQDYSENFSEDFDTSHSSPTAVTPVTSPSKVLTPNNGQGTPTGTWRPANILDTMEEVRWRLRQGVGQKMKTVKRNVQSIRETGRRNVLSICESGSVYMHNIMETGSTAANRVKVGVVMGVETVKSHVQSIKEFCGTGDMGTHTISAISMETNLDTNETREVAKSITIV